MRLITLLVASVFVVGCGGGSGGGSVMAVAVPQVAGEGTILGDGSQVGGIDEHVLTFARRTMFAFDLAPFTQPVAQATLRFVASDLLASLPFVELTVEHIDGGGILDMNDFDSAAFSTNGPRPQVAEHTIDVTMWVNLDIAVNRPTSTFRVSLEQIVLSIQPIRLTLAGTAHADPTLRPLLTITQ